MGKSKSSCMSHGGEVMGEPMAAPKGKKGKKGAMSMAAPMAKGMPAVKPMKRGGAARGR